MSKKQKDTGKSLLAGASVLAAAAAFAGTAYAQQQQPQPQPQATQTEDEEAIVVTGTMIRGNTTSVSPITVIGEDNLDARGISTVQDAIQQLAANNGPALTNSFTANGAFAGGASGASLRGLSTNSTLVLFDGMRAAYYPLADDGTRNFVDLNTIPDDIVERVEVLRDGASSSYGADAIAGVINIITRREFQGASARLEAGMSSRGDAQQDRFSLTLGAGDLSEDGVNAYVSLFHYQSEALFNRDRPFPYNTDDLTGLGGPDNRRNSNVAAGVSTVGDFLLRPYTVNPVTNVITAVPGGQWQHAQSGCLGGGVSRTISAAEALANPTSPGTVCVYDDTNLFGMITPDIERWGLSGHAAFELADDVSAYFEANFMQSTVSYNDIIPAQWYANGPTGIAYPRFSSAQQTGTVPYAPQSVLLYLPVWVCQDRVACDTDPARVLNPNNPFAGAGQVARVIGMDRGIEPPYNETRNRVYRFAGGANGSFENGWDWDVSATAMHTDLRRLQDGYNYIQHMLDVIADGTYNFANPLAPSSVPWARPAQDVADYLTPANVTNASSDLIQVQGTLSMPVFELPGGTAQLAVGGAWIYEAVDAPSGNDDYNGPTQRYFRLNAFGTSGDRTSNAVFFELDAPVIDTLDVNISGRFDDYSTGQNHFSPKIGARWRPFDMLTLRATYSEGFRIPSFGEANALPTTGYVSNGAGLFNDTYLAQYGCTVATFASCPAYIRSGSYGQTTLASPNLEPEESSSWTAGFILRPFEGFTFAADYYEIEKTGAITQPSNSPAIQAYYTGAPIPAGYNVIADAPDPAFPLATPRIAFVESQLVNANTIRSEGWDFAINYNRDLFGVNWNSALDLSYITLLETTFPDGTVERYDGTLGNFNLTAGSGTPAWHGQWVNTFSVGMFDITGTVNWYDGYNLSAMDQGDGYKDCGENPGYSPSGCDVEDAISYDLNVQAHVSDQATLYLSVLNVTDEMPPVDVVTYGAYNYNPVQGGDMILGRYFRAGVRLNF